MTLTGLEAALLSGAVATVTFWGTKAFCEWHSVTKSDCKKCHQESKNRLDEICKKLEQQVKVNRIILTKLRVSVEQQNELENE